MGPTLHHVEIYVSDLKQTAEFWGWLLEELGYTPWEGWQRGISWKQGDMAIVFVQVDPKYQDVPYHRRHVGLNHLAFRVPTREHLDHVIDRLRAHSVPLLYADKESEGKDSDKDAIYFEDPDRIKVEIFVPPHKEEA